MIECLSYNTLSEADRSKDFFNKKVVKCDNLLSKGWYRFKGQAFDQMADKEVAKHHCGTHAPGYMTAGHPTVAEGVVSRKVCFHWTSGNCQWSATIRVRNCGAFYVYELYKPPGCSMRYCGERGAGIEYLFFAVLIGKMFTLLAAVYGGGVTTHKRLQDLN